MNQKYNHNKNQVDHQFPKGIHKMIYHFIEIILGLNLIKMVA